MDKILLKFRFLSTLRSCSGDALMQKLLVLLHVCTVYDRNSNPAFT